MAACSDSETIPLVLVTGASGYLANHIVQQLLEEKSYRLRGTVRNVSSTLSLREQFPSLHIVEADLNDDKGWQEAIEGCTYVIHVASPLPIHVPRDETEVIRPAVDGTRRVLQACMDVGSVRRVVVTSSMTAVSGMGEHGRTYTENDWPDADTLKDPYSKSKTLAERAAWEFVDGKSVELVSIVPGLLLGPLLTAKPGASLEVVKRILENSIPGCPHIYLNTVDVRDAARAHVVALVSERAPGNRYIICGESLWMKEVAQIVYDEFSSQGYRVPTRGMPKFFIWLASLFSSQLDAVLPRIGNEIQFSTQKMKEDLEISTRPVRESIIDSCYSLISKGFVEKKQGYRPRQHIASSSQLD
ncbi:uncharacterized protein LOC134196841 [Corticium candelabrum]|uniref:uncharacterized protein LOC134196841 n=1 Tax=Corticium candelabrum TaxID=121492 RepID=UPI002E264CF7|nr:uncharacterized protein LOC134196841 [Corticium candelabrum]